MHARATRARRASERLACARQLNLIIGRYEQGDSTAGATGDACGAVLPGPREKYQYNPAAGPHCPLAVSRGPFCPECQCPSHP